MRCMEWLLMGALSFAPVTYAAEPVQDKSAMAANTAIGVTAEKPDFEIRLPSNPTTGFSWFLQEYNPTLIQAMSHQFQAPTDKKLIGAPGYEVWKFKANPAAFTVPQQTLMKFVYTRPWAGSETNQRIYTISTLEK